MNLEVAGTMILDSMELRTGNSIPKYKERIIRVDDVDEGVEGGIDFTKSEDPDEEQVELAKENQQLSTRNPQDFPKSII